MNHPSFFALDAYVLEPRPGAVEAHLKTCAQCGAHVASLRVQTPIPPQVMSLEARPRRRARWWGLVFASATVVLSVAVLSLRGPTERITAKGSPSVALWLNRDGKVIVWNGQPVKAGDALRFEIAPAGFTHVTVFDEHTRQVLYEAQVPEGPLTLTPAWQLDGQAQRESLRVVLSRGPRSVDSLQSAACTSDAEAHCVEFTLTQAAPSRVDP